MANVTLEPGYLPDCSGLEPYDFSEAAALRFDPRSYQHYYIDLWGTVAPAVVFGCLAVLGFIFFLCWMCVQRRRQRRAAARRADEAAAGPQFMTSLPTIGKQQLQNGGEAGSGAAEGGAATAPPAGLPRAHSAGQKKRRLPWGLLLKLSIVTLALGLLGVSGWGLEESIAATTGPVTTFWGLIDQGEVLLTNVTTTLTTLDDQLTEINDALNVTSSVVQDIPGFVMLIPGVRDAVRLLQSAPVKGMEAIGGILPQLQSATRGIEDKGLGTIQNLRNNHLRWTSELDSTWRFVVIAVVFGLTMLTAAFAASMVWFMRWEKWSSLASALLWLDVALLMFLGTGLMKGAYEVSSDTCLYVESFTLRVINSSVTPESSRDTALKAANYYFGFHDIPDHLVVYELFGAPTHTVQDIVGEGSLVASLLDLLSAGSGVLNTIFGALGVSEADRTTIIGLVDLVPQTVDTVAEVDQLANRANVEPIYMEAKEWVCCELKQNIHDMWVAWTVAGALGWALGALCSLRIVLHTLGIGRGDSASAPSPARTAAPDGSPDGLDPKAASFLVAKEAGHTLPPGASVPVPTEVGEV